MKRVTELDGIRGLAVLGIVCYHLAPGLAPQGWAAVDCFFVLSGYLITAILLMNCDDPRYFSNFYARRALRIWPIYYLGLLAVIVAYRYMPTNYPLNEWMVVQYATYTQNVQLIWGDASDRAIRAFAHTWTLAIEEQFYLLWPLVVRSLPRRGLALVSAAIALGSVAVRAMGMSWEVLPARCDGFALGALLALMMTGRTVTDAARGPRVVFFAATATVAGAILAIKFWGPEEFHTPWGTLRYPSLGTWIAGPFAVLFFGLIGIVISHAGRKWLGFLRCRPLVYLGTISYGVYLYHIPALFAIEAIFRKLGSGHSLDASRPLFRGIIELGATIVVASISWRYFEKPVLSFKSRFRPVVESAPKISRGGFGDGAPSVPLNTTTLST